MSETNSLLPLVAIVGPTASGKSVLGVKLAERFGGEVVACDSTQLYRGFDIGTAKPTPAERCGIPHHWLNFLNRRTAPQPAGSGQWHFQFSQARRNGDIRTASQYAPDSL